MRKNTDESRLALESIFDPFEGKMNNESETCLRGI